MLKSRISKPFECFLDEKLTDDEKYPDIITAHCSTAATIAKYIVREIQNIDENDIFASKIASNEYPTVLVVGQKQYLNIIEKKLKKHFTGVKRNTSDEISYDISNGYDILIDNNNSNLGWRIIAEFILSSRDFKFALSRTTDGTPMNEILTRSIIYNQNNIINMLNEARINSKMTNQMKYDLTLLIPEHADAIINAFDTRDTASPKDEINDNDPTIMLTTFEGCKGLSAGHVFIVGMNNNELPKNPGNVTDIELSRFIVAMTRTRNCCHILSNKYFVFDSKQNKFPPPNYRSIFINWIPPEHLNDLGQLKAGNISIV